MQLVELQQTVATTDAAVYAISRDTVEVVAAFAEEKGITYPLLVDPTSATIGDLGLLNTTIEEDQAYWGFGFKEERHGGLPYPGTFVLDERGIVIEKHMTRDYKIRPSGGLLLEELGIDRSAKGAATASGPGASLAVWTDEDTYFPLQDGVLRVRLRVDEGMHVYVPPNPDGYTNVLVSVQSPDGVAIERRPLPEGSDFRIEGLPEKFVVADGTLTLDVGFRLTEGTGPAEVTVSVAYQACSDTECLIPASLSGTVTIGERERV